MKNTIYLPLEFEHFLSRFGGNKKYHGCVGPISIIQFLKIIKELNKHIEKLIEVNIQFSDKEHYNKIQNILKNINSINKKDSHIEIKVMQYLWELLFLLLEDENRKKYLGGAKIKKSNKYRSLLYSQTIEQKNEIIQRYVDNLYSSDKTKRDIITAYFYKIHYNPLKCVEYFKKDCKEDYEELFFN